MVTSFNFRYCCADRFRTIYRKLMSTYRKQYGRKGKEDIAMKFTETVDKKKFIRSGTKTISRKYNLELCPKCYKMYYVNRSIKEWSQYNVKMEIIHGK